jgi:hypothetical protein
LGFRTVARIANLGAANLQSGSGQRVFGTIVGLQ